MAQVVILDYGSGNLRSAERALQRVGARVEVTADFDAALNAEALVVPGVGAFAACMSGLRGVRGDKIIDRRLAGGRPVLGICVGMQILFDRGVEYSQTEGKDAGAAGCGEWPGVVERLRAEVLPHMGWNTVRAPAQSQLFAGLDEQTRFYFVHSYAVRHWTLEPPPPLVQPIVTWAEHGEPFVAAAEHGPLAGTQFHPEKSSDAGATLLRNWLKSLS